MTVARENASSAPQKKINSLSRQQAGGIVLIFCAISGRRAVSAYVAGIGRKFKVENSRKRGNNERVRAQTSRRSSDERARFPSPPFRFVNVQTLRDQVVLI